MLVLWFHAQKPCVFIMGAILRTRKASQTLKLGFPAAAGSIAI